MIPQLPNLNALFHGLFAHPFHRNSFVFHFLLHLHYLLFLSGNAYLELRDLPSVYGFGAFVNGAEVRELLFYVLYEQFFYALFFQLGDTLENGILLGYFGKEVF